MILSDCCRRRLLAFLLALRLMRRLLFIEVASFFWWIGCVILSLVWRLYRRRWVVFWCSVRRWFRRRSNRISLWWLEPSLVRLVHLGRWLTRSLVSRIQGIWERRWVGVCICHAMPNIVDSSTLGLVWLLPWVLGLSSSCPWPEFPPAVLFTPNGVW